MTITNKEVFTKKLKHLNKVKFTKNDRLNLKRVFVDNNYMFVTTGKVLVGVDISDCTQCNGDEFFQFPLKTFPTKEITKVDDVEITIDGKAERFDCTTLNYKVVTQSKVVSEMSFNYDFTLPVIKGANKPIVRITNKGLEIWYDDVDCVKGEIEFENNLISSKDNDFECKCFLQDLSTLTKNKFVKASMTKNNNTRFECNGYDIFVAQLSDSYFETVFNEYN